MTPTRHRNIVGRDGNIAKSVKGLKFQTSLWVLTFEMGQQV